MNASCETSGTTGATMVAPAAALRRARFGWAARRIDVLTSLDGVGDRLAAMTGLVPAAAEDDGAGHPWIQVTEGDDGRPVFLTARWQQPVVVADATDAMLRLCGIASWQMFDEASYVVHAAGVMHGGAAHLLVGEGYAGKSTLSVAAWLSGLTLIGDDYVEVRPGEGLVRPVPKPLKVRTAATEPPPAMRARIGGGSWMAGRLDDERVLVIGRDAPGILPLHAAMPCASVTLLRRHPGPRSRMLPAPRHVMVPALIEGIIAGPPAVTVLLRALLQAGRSPAMATLEMGEGDQAGALALLLDAWDAAVR